MKAAAVQTVWGGGTAQKCKLLCAGRTRIYTPKEICVPDTDNTFDKRCQKYLSTRNAVCKEYKENKILFFKLQPVEFKLLSGTLENTGHIFLVKIFLQLENGQVVFRNGLHTVVDDIFLAHI